VGRQNLIRTPKGPVRRRKGLVVIDPELSFAQTKTANLTETNGVDNFVAEEASQAQALHSISTGKMQQAHYQSLRNNRIS